MTALQTTAFLESKITAYHQDKEKQDKKKKKQDKNKRATLDESDVKKFLRKADVKYIGFSNRLPMDTPKRLMSEKRSVFKNKSLKEATYIIRKSAEDSVIAQLQTREGFSLGVNAGMSGGLPVGLNLGISASYSQGTEHHSGSTVTSKREMEAHVVVPPQREVTATETTYHTDYTAVCEFDITVEESREIKYKWGKDFFRTDVDVKELPGFKKCEQDLIQEGKGRDDLYHLSCSLQSKLTEVEHEFQVELNGEPADTNDDK